MKERVKKGGDSVRRKMSKAERKLYRYKSLFGDFRCKPVAWSKSGRWLIGMDLDDKSRLIKTKAIPKKLLSELRLTIPKEVSK